MPHVTLCPVNTVPLNANNNISKGFPTELSADANTTPIIQLKHLNPAWAWQILEPWPALANETQQVDWLISHFNSWFAHRHAVLVRSTDEPEYLPATHNQPARIMFAHGYFASALHEISHWCIAGEQRRTLPDLGYWYAPDGRTAEQQALFEQVEIKPQALEWLFTTACQRKFQVSLDNLNGEAGSGDTFKRHVHARVIELLSGNAVLPVDAQHFLYCLQHAIRPQQPLSADEFLPLV